MLLQLANRFEQAGQTARLLRLAAYSERELRYYLDQVPVIFAYRLADNEENQRRQRVGRNSGFRQGVRNPNFIPAGKQAKSRGNSTRYYDLGRQNWRMWRPGNVVSVTAFWSVYENQFVDTPEAAGLVGNKPFTAFPGRDPEVNKEREKRTATREKAKREREQVRVNRALRR